MQSKRSNSKTSLATTNKENIDDTASSSAALKMTAHQWNVPEKHMIHLKAQRIIGSGSFGT